MAERPHSHSATRAGLICLAWLAVAGTAAFATGLPITSADLGRLAGGEVLISVEPDPRLAAARIAAVIDIPASPALVWATMLNCGRAPKYIGGLVSCRILERDPAGRSDVREHIVSWLSLLPQIRSVFRSHYDLHKSIVFKRVGGDIDVLEGTWTFEALNGGAATRLRYAAVVGKETLVPSALIRAAISNDVPKTLRSLRAEVLRGQR